MDPEFQTSAIGLVRTMVLLQLKLLLGAGRDLMLTPLTLIAALLDLILLKQEKQEPRFLRMILKFGERTDAWIDVWSGSRDAAEGPPRENVDKLLMNIEHVVRDPQSGARRARVLKRWAERQVTRRVKQHMAPASAPPASAPASAPPTGRVEKAP
jgi:hypothetical protein